MLREVVADPRRLRRDLHLEGCLANRGVVVSWFPRLKFWGKKKVAELSEYADLTEMDDDENVRLIPLEMDDESVAVPTGNPFTFLNVFPPADKDDFGPKIHEEFVDQNELARIQEREFIKLTSRTEEELEASLFAGLDNTTPEFREMAKRGINLNEMQRIHRSMTLDTANYGRAREAERTLKRYEQEMLQKYTTLPIQSIADRAAEIMNDRPNDDSDALLRVSGLWGETYRDYGADSGLSEVFGYRNHPRSQWWRNEIAPLLEAARLRQWDRQTALSDMRDTVHHLRELRKQLLGDVGCDRASGILIYTHPDYVEPLSTIEEDFRKLGLIT